MLTYVDMVITRQAILNKLQEITPVDTVSTYAINQTHIKYVRATVQSECTYKKDVSVYMDAFDEVIPI